jgi:hypothetical protein
VSHDDRTIAGLLGATPLAGICDDGVVGDLLDRLLVVVGRGLELGHQKALTNRLVTQIEKAIMPMSMKKNFNHEMTYHILLYFLGIAYLLGKI